MGQTVNPNIFRLGKTKNWTSKYFAKKTSEVSLYAFKNLEIRKFIDKFFKDNELTVSNCKINYSDDGSLHIFVSYYLNSKTILLINNLTKEQKISIVKARNKKKVKMKKKQKRIIKSLDNYIMYQIIKHKELLNRLVSAKNLSPAIESIIRENTTRKIRRIKLLKFYKNLLAIKNYKNFDSVKTNYFTAKLFNSLHLFLKKNIKIFLTLQQLNKNTSQKSNKSKIKFLKKSLIKLKKFKQNEFFKEGINILFLTTTETQMANLLSKFISINLSKLKKKHNFFLKFITTTLKMFESSSFSNIKGIKIKISGRLNGRPRARHKFITIGSGVPIITLNSQLDYAESTAYTPNGTLGVKVWICNT